MLSPFGRWVRAFREERKMTLREMARTIERTPSYLSAIELGRKSVPDTMLSLLNKHFSITDEMNSDLHNAIRDSKLSAEVKFDQSTSVDDRRLATVFARTFEKLPKDKKLEILDWMEKLDE